jgi:hypothetical protein
VGLLALAIPPCYTLTVKPQPAMSTLTPPTDQLHLHFSQQPEVKQGQIDILSELLDLIGRSDDTSEVNRSIVMELASKPELSEAVARVLKNLPKTQGRGTFAEMQQQRDASGLLRRPS